MSLGISVAVINGNNEILLVKRKDYHVWCMPGGRVEIGESLSEAAIRETYEETNIKIQVEYLIGSYSRPHWYDNFYHVLLFKAKPITNNLIFQKDECVDIGYFSQTNIPKNLLLGQKNRIEDVFSNRVGLAVNENIRHPFPQAKSLKETYKLKDDSNLEPEEFYDKYYKVRDNKEIIIESKRIITL